jgi:hypothetical protein
VVSNLAMAMAMKEVATIRSETMPGRALACPEQASQEHLCIY